MYNRASVPPLPDWLKNQFKILTGFYFQLANNLTRFLSNLIKFLEECWITGGRSLEADHHWIIATKV